MMHRILIAGMAVVLSPLSAAADLSGDFRTTITDPDGRSTTQAGKIYMDGAPESPDRTVRMELQPDGSKEPLVFLTRPQDQAMYMVMPSAKTYMKLSFDEGKKKAPQAPGQGLSPADFKTIGRERVNGRETIVKEAPLRDGEKTTGTIRVFVAPDLGNEFIKSEVQTDRGVKSTTVIENPDTGNLPGSLFTVPSGYAETELPSLNKMMEGLGKGAKDESEDAAREQKEKAADELRRGLRGKLPF